MLSTILIAITVLGLVLISEALLEAANADKTWTVFSPGGEAQHRAGGHQHAGPYGYP